MEKFKLALEEGLGVVTWGNGAKWKGEPGWEEMEREQVLARGLAEPGGSPRRCWTRGWGGVGGRDEKTRLDVR